MTTNKGRMSRKTKPHECQGSPQAEPTPRPWAYDNERGQLETACGDVMIAQVDTMLSRNSDADGAFIVRAVNAHDGLVKALRRMVEWYDAGCDQSAAAVSSARAALKAAGEDI